MLDLRPGDHDTRSEIVRIGRQIRRPRADPVGATASNGDVPSVRSGGREQVGTGWGDGGREYEEGNTR